MSFAGVMHGRPEMLRRWREEMEQGHRHQRVQLAKAHFEEARAIERGAAGPYRSGLEGSEDRAEVAARSSWSTRQYQVHYDPRVEDWRVRAYAEQERMDQVREVDGEEAYQKRKRAWERASQPLVPSRFPSHDRPQRRGPERGGPERDSGPSR